MCSEIILDWHFHKQKNHIFIKVCLSVFKVVLGYTTNNFLVTVDDLSVNVNNKNECHF